MKTNPSIPPNEGFRPIPNFLENGGKVEAFRFKNTYPDGGDYKSEELGSVTGHSGLAISN